MQLTANQLSLAKLLDDGTRIRIPEYQRNYAWEAANIDQYMSDLAEAIRSKEDHFFGSIVLLDEGDDNFSVIDGQQRLTTTIMLLSLVRDYLADMEDPNHEINGTHVPMKTFVDQMLKHKNYVDYRFTANHQIAEIFLDYIMRDPGPLRKELTKSGKGGKFPLKEDKDRENTKALRSAYFRLSDGFREMLAEHNPNETVLKGFIFDLIDTLRNSLKILRIAVPDEADAYVLFETLNDRGVRLTAPDLLKSYTLREAKGLQQDKVDDIINKWDLAVERLGSYPFEKFLRHYLLATQDKEPVQVKKIFPMFKERIQQVGPIENLDDIADASLRYAKILNDKIETPDDDLNATLDRMNLFSQTHRVFLLAVFEGDWSAELLRYAARATERLAFRWTLRGLNAQVLENIYQKYAGRVRREALPGNVGALTTILDDLMAEAPGDEEIRNEITTGSIKKNLLGYLLTRVEGALSGDLLRWTKQGTSTIPLAPISPSKDSNWYEVIAPPKAKAGGDEKSYEDFVQMWGNHTLIEFDLDSSIAHTNWQKKVQGSVEVKGLSQSKVALNEDVVDIPQWSASDIVRRTEWLADATVLVSSVGAAQNDSVRFDRFIS